VAPAVTRVVCDLPVPELDDALPRTPRDPERVVALADRWGLDSALERFLARSRSRRAADYLTGTTSGGAQASGVGGLVVGLLLRVALCLNAREVVLDLQGRVLLVPVEQRRHQLGDDGRRLDAAVPRLDRRAGAPREHVVEVTAPSWVTA
jgi:hypothetical protein